MAYTFFKAMGKPVGKSLVEDDKLDSARDDHGAHERVRRSVRLQPDLERARASVTASGGSRRRAKARSRCAV